MAGIHGHPYLTIGLETSDTWPMPRTRIDDDEGPSMSVDLYALWRNNPDQRIIDRLRQLPAVNDKLRCEVEDVRRRLSEVLAILIAAFA
jgi:hypothetical protein